MNENQTNPEPLLSREVTLKTIDLLVKVEAALAETPNTPNQHQVRKEMGEHLQTLRSLAKASDKAFPAIPTVVLSMVAQEMRTNQNQPSLQAQDIKHIVKELRKHGYVSFVNQLVTDNARAAPVSVVNTVKAIYDAAVNHNTQLAYDPNSKEMQDLKAWVDLHAIQVDGSQQEMERGMDFVMVHGMAAAMHAKMAAESWYNGGEKRGWYTAGPKVLSDLLHKAVAAGDLVSIANYAAMLHYQGNHLHAPITPPWTISFDTLWSYWDSSQRLTENQTQAFTNKVIADMRRSVQK